MDQFEHEEKIEQFRSNNDKFCQTRSGLDWDKEATADWILAQSRRGVMKHSELRDWLSKSQIELRQSREVYPASGTPEKHLYSGIYGRAYNPNSRGPHSSKATPNLDNDVVEYE